MTPELRDIHLPDPVSWWPPAPGWYGILILLLIMLALAMWLQRRNTQTPKMLALHELKQIEQAYLQHKNAQQTCGDVSILLRRTAMSIGARDKHASLTGETWITELNALCDKPIFDASLAPLLLQAPYQSTPQQEQAVQHLLQAVRRWLNELRKPA